MKLFYNLIIFIFFAEIQRNIIANDSVHNNRYEYAVSFCKVFSLVYDNLFMSTFFFSFQDNNIKTSKYTLLTFLPLNLFEQFQRLANFYFLCLLILQVRIYYLVFPMVTNPKNKHTFQLIDVISSLTPVTTAVPLVGVLSLIAVKDAYDDFVSFLT